MTLYIAKHVFADMLDQACNLPKEYCDAVEGFTDGRAQQLKDLNEWAINLKRARQCDSQLTALFFAPPLQKSQ